MPSNTEPDPKLLLQRIEPGTTLPEIIPSDGLFLLNLSSIMKDGVWDAHGNKELNQAGSLRNFATRLIEIADTMDELGHALKAYPDADDYEIYEYKVPWDYLMDEMSDVFSDGYKKIAAIVESMADEATGDFMD